MSGDRETQQDVCGRLGVAYSAPEGMVAVALSTIGKMPVYGQRCIMDEGHTISWFIHCGEDSWSDVTDFYKPLCTEHLHDILPLAIKYLALPPGSKFVIDDGGYEDVWQEPA